MSDAITRFVSAEWPRHIALDIADAKHTIIASALSCQPPRRIATTGLSPLWLALVSAAARRRRVVLILPASTRTHPATAHNNTTAQTAAAVGITVSLVPMPRLLHAKTVSIDGRISWVGSGNFTAAAASHNHEAWIRTEDEQTAAELLHFHRTLTPI